MTRSMVTVWRHAKCSRVFMKRSFLSSSYQEVASVSLNPVELAQSYTRLCCRVGKLEKDTALRCSLVQTQSVTGSTWGASLTTTIKTHKGNGCIEHRNIHAAANPKFRGLSFWVSAVLDDELKQLPHLLMPSKHLVSLLPSVTIEPSDKLVRIDFETFLHVRRCFFLERWCQCHCREP